MDRSTGIPAPPATAGRGGRITGTTGPMLLDDTQVAIDELLAACQESATHYADAAGRVGTPALAGLFDGIAAERRDDVECLAGIVRDSGRLPRAPYADRRDLHQFVTHAKAALADDEARVLLDDRIADERRLGELADGVLRQAPDAATRDCVERIGRRAGEARARLTDAIGGNDG